MLLEHWIFLATWVLGIIGFLLFIPRKDRRVGIMAFMIFQALIWLCDMPAFKFNLLSAPVRILPKATNLALTINYIFYPVLFSIYYVHRRVKGNLWSKFLYFFVWISAVTLLDMVIERYTDLLEYGFLTWYGMWGYISFLFYVSQVCCNRFFKDKSSPQAERWATE